jgi:hypothetical protein
VYFITQIEKDYKNFDIIHTLPEQLSQRNLKVMLPNIIFSNLAELFFILLDSIEEDEIASELEKLEQVMRVMIFSKLFHN